MAAVVTEALFAPPNDRHRNWAADNYRCNVPAGKVFGKWELRTEGRHVDKIVEKGLYLPTATSGLSISGLIRLLSQEPTYRESVEHSKGKGSVGLRRIVGKGADNAVKRLH